MESHRRAVQRMEELGYRLRGRWPLGNLNISVYALPTARKPAPPRLAASKPS